MKGLKFIFESWRKMPFFFWFGIVFSIAVAVLPFIFHNDTAADEYMFPKMFIFFPAVFMTEIGLICGCRDIAGNKLVRSFPIAKELYTRALPTFVMLLTLGVSAVTVTAYFIFLGIIGAEAAQFADTLLIGAMITAAEFIASVLFAYIPGGGLFCVYVAALLPIVLISTIGGDTVMRSGFGVPLPAAALISAAAIAASAVLMFVISKRRYKTSNIKINNLVMNYETK